VGHFVIKAKNNLSTVKIGDRISESDFSAVLSDGQMIQMTHKESDRKGRSCEVKPGLWCIAKGYKGYKLEKTSFVVEDILPSFVQTKTITEKIDCFINNLDAYYKMKIEVPKRAMLIYGVPGLGKTASIKAATEKYLLSNDTAIIIWPTDRFDAYEVKNFIKTFKYKNTKFLIFIVEDIGGAEQEQVRVKSDSSLLSLLDNQEKTFTIPVFITATTNHPEIFLGNLTNRPGRFDDKVEFSHPTGDERAQLLEFFNGGALSKEDSERIKSKKFAEFTPAHLKEVVLRSAIYNISLEKSSELIYTEIENFKKAFSKVKRIGIVNEDDNY
jgi:SpoVK/Ycf46/Vps4 family AAA+-type ATPase